MKVNALVKPFQSAYKQMKMMMNSKEKKIEMAAKNAFDKFSKDLQYSVKTKCPPDESNIKLYDSLLSDLKETRNIFKEESSSVKEKTHNVMTSLNKKKESWVKSSEEYNKASKDSKKATAESTLRMYQTIATLFGQSITDLQKKM